MKTVFFDFDGTLVDSGDQIIRILQKLAPIYRYKQLSDEDVPQLKDMSNLEMMKFLRVSHWKLPFITFHARRIARGEMDKLSPFDGIKDLLDEISSRGGVTGILTSNSKSNVEKFLVRHPLHVKKIVGGAGMFQKAKLLKQLSQEFGKDFYYVGDETRDIEAAKEAGVRSIAVTWGHNSERALKEALPDHIVRSVPELMSLLS